MRNGLLLVLVLFGWAGAAVHITSVRGLTTIYDTLTPWRCPPQEPYLRVYGTDLAVWNDGWSDPETWIGGGQFYPCEGDHKEDSIDLVIFPVGTLPAGVHSIIVRNSFNDTRDTLDSAITVIAVSPRLDSVTVDTCREWDTVNVVGRYFNSSRGDGWVQICGARARSYVLWSDTLVRAVVRRGDYSRHDVILCKYSGLKDTILNAITMVARKTECAIVLNIDGIRRSEDSLYSTLVNNWFDSNGVHIDECWNLGVTVTASGHNSVQTGVWNYLPNNTHAPESPMRPNTPALPEYLRHFKGWPSDSVFTITGKDSIYRYPSSTLAGYGYIDSGRVVRVPSDPAYDSLEDFTCRDSVMHYLRTKHPRYMYAVFAAVDVQGHWSELDTPCVVGASRYVRQIIRTDALVRQVIDYVDTAAAYRGRTMVVIITDHGRHSDSLNFAAYRGTAWIDHGCSCYGCKHLICKMSGPELKWRTRTSVKRSQIDVAPTVGHLLGCQLPYAKGRVMREVLYNAASVSSSFQYRSPDICADNNGVHLVCERVTNGRTQIVYSRRPLSNFTAPTRQFVLFDTTAGATLSNPSIVSFGGKLLAVAMESAPVTYLGEWFGPQPDTTYVWRSVYRLSDRGDRWSPAAVLDSSHDKYHRVGMSVKGGTDSVLLGWTGYHYVFNRVGYSYGASWNPSFLIRTHDKYHPQKVTVGFTPTRKFSGWQVVHGVSPSRTWRLYGSYDVTTTDTAAWIANTPTAWIHDPSMATWKGDSVLVMISRCIDTANLSWRVRGTRVAYGAFVNVTNPTHTLPTFQPHLVRTHADTLAVCYVKYARKNRYLVEQLRTINNGVSWVPEVLLSDSLAGVEYPRMSSTGSNRYTTWAQWDTVATRWDVVLRNQVSNYDTISGEFTYIERPWTSVNMPVYFFEARSKSRTKYPVTLYEAPWDSIPHRFTGSSISGATIIAKRFTTTDTTTVTWPADSLYKSAGTWWLKVGPSAWSTSKYFMWRVAGAEIDTTRWYLAEGR